MNETNLNDYYTVQTIPQKSHKIDELLKQFAIVYEHCPFFGVSMFLFGSLGG